MSHKETDIEKETTVNDVEISLEDETKLLWLRRFLSGQEDERFEATTEKAGKKNTIFALEILSGRQYSY
jgi:hypothetical protein